MLFSIPVFGFMQDQSLFVHHYLCFHCVFLLLPGVVILPPSPILGPGYLLFSGIDKCFHFWVKSQKFIQIVYPLCLLGYLLRYRDAGFYQGLHHGDISGDVAEVQIEEETGEGKVSIESVVK